MIEYLKANFDLTEIQSFNFNINTGVLTVHGTDGLGRLKVGTKNLSKLDGARLFRLYIKDIPGL